MKLFDDDADDVSKIEINPEFAKRYEHNKKREDLHKYEEMKKKGLIESGSESVSESDSDGADDIVDGKFIDRLLKIRKKDPNLLQKESKLFDSSDDDDEDEEKEAKKAKKAKPKYLKDLNAENLIENGAEFDEDEEEEKERKKVKSFVEEQEDLRKSVLAAMAEEEEQRLIGDDDDDDGLLTVKERDVVEEDEVDGEMNEKLDEFFGEDEKLDENDKFLKEFFRNKMWIDKGQGLGGGGGGEGEIELSDDEEAVLRQEEYERDFNFRFEESKSDRVLGHSRVVVDSVRNDKNTRKLQRERKKDKERLAKIEMDEEVKRLKNLKRAEIRDRLRKIREIAGVVDQDQDQGGIPLDEDYLEKDFDPKEFDETMKVAFGDDYYQADDDHFKPVFGSDDDLGKPDFGKEDELLGLPKDWDVIKSKDGFLAKRGKKDNKEIIVDDEDDDEEEEEHEEKVEEGKRKRKRKSKIGEALKKELEEELYKYDYEDAIGDLKTRFKYRKVKPNKYKLSAAEVLWYDEQELNQYVSLKKLAPYREQEWEVRGDRKNMLNVGILSGKNMNEKKGKMDGEGSSKTIDEEQSNKDKPKQSRGARRRENMKKKQLSVSRLVAYGKNPSSSSKKK